MASFCILEKFEVHKNERFLQIAKNLEPELNEEIIEPRKVFSKQADILNESPGISEKPVLKKDDAIVYDFGSHYVGYVTLDLSSAGRHPDAPAYIYFKFAERIDELKASMEEYDGWLSKSWIQEEYIHVDVLPYKLSLPRRYAFRYMEVRVIDVSPKFSLVVNSVSMRAVSAVQLKDVPEFILPNINSCRKSRLASDG